MNPPNVRLVLVPGHTSYSPGAAAPTPPFRSGYTEYIQASKLIDSIQEAVDSLGLKWQIERMDGSHKEPYRESQQFKRKRLSDLETDLLPESDMETVVVEIHFSSSVPNPKKQGDPQAEQPAKEEGKRPPIMQSGSGIRTFFKAGDPESERLARTVHGEMLRAIPIPDRGVGFSERSGILNSTRFPAIQVRPLFIDGQIDPQFLRFARSRMFIAQAILAGVDKFIKGKRLAEGRIGSEDGDVVIDQTGKAQPQNELTV